MTNDCLFPAIGFDEAHKELIALTPQLKRMLTRKEINLYRKCKEDIMNLALSRRAELCEDPDGFAFAFVICKDEEQNDIPALSAFEGWKDNPFYALSPRDCLLISALNRSDHYLVSVPLCWTEEYKKLRPEEDKA